MSADFQGSLSAFFDVKKGERFKTFLLFLWLFLFICGYYVLRPVRRGLVLDGLGNDKMPFIYIGTALVTGLVVWLYSRYAHLPRKQLIGTIYAIFLVNLLMCWGAFQFESAMTSGVFWVWLDVFSIMGVTLFWMYANDLFDSFSAKRLFGIISAGGGLGAVLGSSITAALVKQLGATNMILVAAAIVAATLGIFLVLESRTAPRPTKRSTAAEFQKQNLSQISGVLSLIFSNRFLFFLTMVVCFERIAPDLVQFLYQEVLTRLATGRDAIAALDANLERWRAIFEFAVELCLVSAILRRFGSGFCLSSPGVIILGSLVAFTVFPNPYIILALFHSDEAARHSWFKAAKELTYTVTSRDVLYKVKPVIEMFFYRFSRGVAGLLIFCVYTVLGLGTAGLVATALASAGFWSYCGWQLNRHFRRLELEASRETVRAESAAPVAV